MQQWIQEIMQKYIEYGYLIIFLLIAIENIFPPIPSEVILTFGGYLTTRFELTMWLVVLAATAGSVFGAIVLYGVGRIFSPERLERWMNGRLGRLLHLKAEDVEKAKRWFDSRGKSTIFFCRFIPVVRSLISIPAGMSRMKLPVFLLYTTAGTFIWNTVLVSLGTAAGAAWERVNGYMDAYSRIGVIVLGIILAVAVFVFYRNRRKQKGDGKTDSDKK